MNFICRTFSYKGSVSRSFESFALLSRGYIRPLSLLWYGGQHQCTAAH